MPLSKQELLAEAARCRREAARMRARANDMASADVRRSIFSAADNYDRIAREFEDEAANL